MASLLAGAIPILGELAKSALPIIGDIGKSVLPGVLGAAGDKAAQMSPEAKEAFCGCKKEKKYIEPEIEDYDEMEPDYGYKVIGKQHMLKPRRKHHLRRRAKY